jgi:hypothetical protein
MPSKTQGRAVASGWVLAGVPSQFDTGRTGASRMAHVLSTATSVDAIERLPDHRYGLAVEKPEGAGARGRADV